MGGAGGVTRELRIGLALLVALGAFTAFMLVVGSLGEPRAEVNPLTVEEALEGPERWGSQELHVVGWYAELAGATRGSEPARPAARLRRPLRRSCGRGLRARAHRALSQDARGQRLRRAGALAPRDHVEQACLARAAHEPGEGGQRQ